jgi:hypothetical protein
MPSREICFGFAERDQAGLWQGFTSCVDRQTGFVQFWTVVSAHGRIGSGWNQRWIFDFVL